MSITVIRLVTFSMLLLYFYLELKRRYRHQRIYKHLSFNEKHRRKIKKSEESLLTHDAKFLASRLENLVELASQFHEHIEKRRIDKIEMDLKLAEAESALEYYRMTVGEK
jgi:hypothetical protein